MSELHKAVRDRSIEDVRRLIVSGKIDVNEKDNMKRTALHLACWTGELEIVKLLIRSKAKVDALAMDNFTALHFAAQQSNSVEIIRELVKKERNLLKMRVTKGNKTALHLAISKGDISVVQCLLELGSDVTAKTGPGQTSLELAKSDEVYQFVKKAYEERLKAKEAQVEKLKKAASGVVTDEEGAAAVHEGVGESGSVSAVSGAPDDSTQAAVTGTGISTAAANSTSSFKSIGRKRSATDDKDDDDDNADSNAGAAAQLAVAGGVGATVSGGATVIGGSNRAAKAPRVVLSHLEGDDEN